MHTMTDERSDGPEIVAGMQPKSFLAFLADQETGGLVSELSVELRDTVEAIENYASEYHGKAVGEMTIKVKITLDRGIYKIEVEHSVKRPKPPATTTMMWLDGLGNLGTSNPKQLTMPFSAVGPKGAA